MQTIAVSKNHLNFSKVFPETIKGEIFELLKNGTDSKNISSQLGNDNSSRNQPSEFLSSITHELKTPLNAVIGFADILQEEISNPQSHEDCLGYIADIKNVALEMKELVNDLLDVGQIASGNFSVNLKEKIDVSDAIKRSVKLNYDYSLKRNIALKTEVSGEIPLINLDAKRMKQILTNLISNSLKYSPQKTEIKISAQNILLNQQKYLQIIVADQGFGMSPSQVKTAFEKYQTIENPNSGKVDSFGLGLAIVKQLVELQNGIIEVRSELNKGTEVKLKFAYLM